MLNLEKTSFNHGKKGLTIEEGAKRFAVGKVSISRWKNNPDPTFKRKIDMDALKKEVELNPDSFIYERAERFFVSNSGIRRKKSSKIS